MISTYYRGKLADKMTQTCIFGSILPLLFNIATAKNPIVYLVVEQLKGIIGTWKQKAAFFVCLVNHRTDAVCTN